MAEAALDTLAVIETPEGVTLRLAAAGVLPRLVARIIDGLVLGVFQGAMAVGLGLAGQLGVGVMLIIAFTAQWLYPVLFEVLNDGQTIGKRALNLQAVHDDGTPVRLAAAAVRNLLFAVDILPGPGTVGMLSMLIDARFRRVGDRAAGTMVIYKPTRATPVQAMDVTPLLLTVPLRVEEQQLLVAFAERQATLSRERVEELAAFLEPLTGRRAQEGIETLQRLARGILGSA